MARSFPSLRERLPRGLESFGIQLAVDTVRAAVDVGEDAAQSAAGNTVDGKPGAIHGVIVCVTESRWPTIAVANDTEGGVR